MELATVACGPMMGLREKGAMSMNLINRVELMERAERWPVPIVVLVTSCLIMTAAAVWA
jgi:hypothetical protein